jgi:hypothetical protein
MTDMGAGEADGTGQISRRVGKSQSFLTVINAMIFTHTRMLAGGCAGWQASGCRASSWSSSRRSLRGPR